MFIHLYLCQDYVSLSLKACYITRTENNLLFYKLFGSNKNSYVANTEARNDEKECLSGPFKI